VAISQRSIPKDQLYESKRKIKKRCFVPNTTKMSSLSLFSPRVLPLHRKIDLHITLDGVNVVINRFWSHPFHRKLLCILSTVHVSMDLSHQPKVWHFDSVITANQNITSCQVTMNEASLCEMILKNYERIKRTLGAGFERGRNFLWKRKPLVFVMF